MFAKYRTLQTSEGRLCVCSRGNILVIETYNYHSTRWFFVLAGRSVGGISLDEELETPVRECLCLMVEQYLNITTSSDNYEGKIGPSERHHTRNNRSATLWGKIADSFHFGSTPSPWRLDPDAFSLAAFSLFNG